MDNDVRNKILDIVNQPTCYPEKQRKTDTQRYVDLCYWYEKYNDINEVYNLWGMDCVDAISIDEWLDRGLFRKQRHDVNAFFYPNGSKFPMDYTVVMRDKRMFEAFAEMVLGYGNKYSPSIGYIIEKSFYFKQFIIDKIVDFQKFIEIFDSRVLVFKQVFGCSGENVKVVQVNQGYITCGRQQFSSVEFLNMLTNTIASNWVIQEFIIQHPMMKRLNDTSVNTLRFVTYHTGDDVEYYPVIMMRYGTPGALVDNANLGVGVDNKGIVMEDAFSLVEKNVLNVMFPVWKSHFLKKRLIWLNLCIAYSRNIYSWLGRVHNSSRSSSHRGE